MALAEKLDLLFKTCTKPNGKEYTYQEVEAGTQGAVSSTYVWKLRTGKNTNPGYRVLQALSDFFSVSPSYFFDGQVSAQHLEHMRLAANLRDEGLQRIAMSAGGLDDTGKALVVQLIEYISTTQNHVGR